MNGLDIMKTVVKDGEACRYFGGLMSIDRLHFKPTSRIFYICNTDVWKNKGKHWVVLYFINETFEYFDPIGNKPDILFSNFMNKYSKDIVFNTKRVQPLNTNTCGEYCIFFASMRSRNINFNEIMKYMQDEKTILDYVNDLSYFN